MSTGGTPRPGRGVVAVACFCLAATTSVVNVSGSIFGFSRASVDGPVPFTLGLVFVRHDLFLLMAIAGALAAAAGLVVISWARRAGWPWLLLAGTVLSAAM